MEISFALLFVSALFSPWLLSPGTCGGRATVRFTSPEPSAAAPATGTRKYKKCTCSVPLFCVPESHLLFTSSSLISITTPSLIHPNKVSPLPRPTLDPQASASRPTLLQLDTLGDFWRRLLAQHPVGAWSLCQETAQQGSACFD